jgi:hypothetical protein
MRIFLLLLAGFSFIACNKEDRNISNRITMKLDGQLVVMDMGATAAGTDLLWLSAHNNSHSIKLELFNFPNAPVSEQVGPNTRISLWMPEIFYAGGDFVGSQTLGKGKIVVQEVNSRYVKGTFDGELVRYVGVPGWDTVIVTDGYFELKRQ